VKMLRRGLKEGLERRIAVMASGRVGEGIEEGRDEWAVELLREIGMGKKEDGIGSVKV
jgi:hypothetical protein